MVRYCNNGTMSDYECIVVVCVHVSMTHTFLTVLFLVSRETVWDWPASLKTLTVLFLVSRETVWDWPASLKTLTPLTLICSVRNQERT